MALPNSVIIAGRKYGVELIPGYGASFDTHTREISVGVDSGTEVVVNFVHELMELILEERLHRYRVFAEDTNDKILFVLNHAEFQCLVSDLLAAINDLLKPEFAQRWAGGGGETSPETS